MSAAVLMVTWVETCIGLIFLAMRFLSSWKFTGRFRWDFGIAALTVVSVPNEIIKDLMKATGWPRIGANHEVTRIQATQTVAQIFLQLSVKAGMGSHAADLSNASRVVALKWGWVFQLLAIGGSMLGKLAILAFLLEIRGRHTSKPWLLIILGVLIFAINITVMGTILGQCSPMEKLWNDALQGTCDPGRKMNQNYSFFQASSLTTPQKPTDTRLNYILGFNVFCDAALATYPVHLFWSLQMKWRIKVALSILMGLGWMYVLLFLLLTIKVRYPGLTQTFRKIELQCVPRSSAMN